MQKNIQMMCWISAMALSFTEHRFNQEFVFYPIFSARKFTLQVQAVVQ